MKVLGVLGLSLVLAGAVTPLPLSAGRTKVPRPSRLGWRGGSDLPVSRVASRTTLLPSTTGGAVLSGNSVTEREEYRRAVVRTVLTVTSAVLFGGGVWAVKGRNSALEFYTGYIVEQSLSVDNLFVFILLFDYFKVPAAFQPRVLNWGIIGAVIMRGIMIVLGVAAIQKFRVVMLLFAALLLVAAGRLVKETFATEEGEEDLSNNWIMNVSRKLVNAVDYYDDDKFFTIRSGVRRATPLLLCLVCIELSDFVFAVDSIPAVLGVSKDPLIVYSSNVFAIAALRSLYVLVAKAIDDLPYLKPAVGLVLGFVGGKMIAEYYHHEMTTAVSLAVIVGILGLSIVASIVIPPSKLRGGAGAVKEEAAAQKVKRMVDNV